VVQRAGERALAQGVGLGDVLNVVRDFRRTNAVTPIVLMGYANPIEAMGIATFAERAKEAGVDGVLVVDYPPDEAAEFTQVLAARDIAAIFLLSPTTTDARIAADADVPTTCQRQRVESERVVARCSVRSCWEGKSYTAYPTRRGPEGGCRCLRCGGGLSPL